MKTDKPARKYQKTNLYRLVLARSDITVAMKACELIIKHKIDISSDFYNSLFYTAVIAYARPFSNNEPFGSLPAKYGRFDDQRLQKTHNGLILARNKFIAHSDRDARQVDIVPAGYIPPGIEKPIMSTGVCIHGRAYTFKRFQNIYDTCLFLGKRIQNEIELLINDLYGNIKLPESPFPLTLDDNL